MISAKPYSKCSRKSMILSMHLKARPVRRTSSKISYYSVMPTPNLTTPLMTKLYSSCRTSGPKSPNDLSSATCKNIRSRDRRTRKPGLPSSFSRALRQGYQGCRRRKARSWRSSSRAPSLSSLTSKSRCSSNSATTIKTNSVKSERSSLRRTLCRARWQSCRRSAETCLRERRRWWRWRTPSTRPRATWSVPSWRPRTPSPTSSKSKCSLKRSGKKWKCSLSKTTT